LEDGTKRISTSNKTVLTIKANMMDLLMQDQDKGRVFTGFSKQCISYFINA